MNKLELFYVDYFTFFHSNIINNIDKYEKNRRIYIGNVILFSAIIFSNLMAITEFVLYLLFDYQRITKFFYGYSLIIFFLINYLYFRREEIVRIIKKKSKSKKIGITKTFFVIHIVISFLLLCSLIYLYSQFG